MYGAFFVHMLCNLDGINLSPGRVVVVTGDTHLYLNHLEGVEENLNKYQDHFLFSKYVR